MRKKSVAYSLTGHMDTVSGISLSPDGNQLLSNGMDNTVRIWDVKPFSATGNRLLKTFEGAPHGFEKNLIRPAWSKDGSMIGVGAGDRTMVIWDAMTRKILYKLPGHKGCVNDVDFHPREPIGKFIVIKEMGVRIGHGHFLTSSSCYNSCVLQYRQKHVLGRNQPKQINVPTSPFFSQSLSRRKERACG